LLLESEFLLRHPALESLYLETEQVFRGGIDTSPPSMLRALSVNEGSLFASPTLVGPGSKITHLRFREIEEDRIQVLADMVRAVGRTLRCLELDVESEEDEPIPRHATDLPSLAPALDELAIIRQRSTRAQPRTGRLTYS
jgi:hypothetical protein